MHIGRPRRFAFMDRIPSAQLTRYQRWQRSTYELYLGPVHVGEAPCNFCLQGFVVRSATEQIHCAVCEGASRVPCLLCTSTGKVTCRDCFGSGLRVLRCLLCDGTGLRFDPRRIAGGLAPDPSVCPRCEDSKWEACERCVLPEEFQRARFKSAGSGPAAAPLPGKWTYTCAACLGTTERPCTRCHGRERAECRDCVGRGRVGWQSANLCGACEGAGSTTCFRCEGAGRIFCIECDRGEAEARCPPCHGAAKRRCSGCLGESSLAWREAAELAESLDAPEDAEMWRRIAFWRSMD
ncbi:MAG: hypothetical protein AAF368_12435, partial [Planctomycetota bacterium]